jgi:UDP-N-acetylmuramoyl-L-alanyl-D-glutamate--2,6-diaminopimelate ligase
LLEWPQLKYAVLNLDDDFGLDMVELLRDQEVEIIGYGLTDTALGMAERLDLRMVYGSALHMSAQGLDVQVHSSWGSGTLHSALLGRFNASNLLGVLAALLVSDIVLHDALRELSKVKAVAGRMQTLGGNTLPTVVIDYAHTPDALEKVLQTLREVSMQDIVPLWDINQEGATGLTGGFSNSKLICVLGCGGNRDAGKRPVMGEIAARLADVCIVTSDNPRNENPQAIIAAIVAGMGEANKIKSVEIIEDRAAAIMQAVHSARAADTVLVAGKGHENYQEINGIKHPFSDILIAQQALQSWSSRAQQVAGSHKGTMS